MHVCPDCFEIISEDYDAEELAEFTYHDVSDSGEDVPESPEWERE
jgi:hypothetical protein